MTAYVSLVTGCTRPGSLAMRKWRENEKMKWTWKWRENEEMERELGNGVKMRKWRENKEMERE